MWSCVTSSQTIGLSGFPGSRKVYPSGFCPRSFSGMYSLELSACKMHRLSTTYCPLLLPVILCPNWRFSLLGLCHSWKCTHGTALYQIRPLVNQDQHCLLQWAAAFWSLGSKLNVPRIEPEMASWDFFTELWLLSNRNASTSFKIYPIICMNEGRPFFSNEQFTKVSAEIKSILEA